MGGSKAKHPYGFKSIWNWDFEPLPIQAGPAEIGAVAIFGNCKQDLQFPFPCTTYRLLYSECFCTFLQVNDHDEIAARGEECIYYHCGSEKKTNLTGRNLGC